MGENYFRTEALNVGYDGNILINDININIEQGQIFTLIGPNGSGKSTILKSITKHLKTISGKVYVQDKTIHDMSYRELSTRIAVVLTDRLKPELMTCYELVATGRYPYTGRLGILTKEDEIKVEEAMHMVHAYDLRDRLFTAISDGQKQRILLARAICQEPEIIVLDEPTSFLDIKHKIGLLNILRKMAKEKNITIVMSLHEIDLAQKISDVIMCVKGDHITECGTPDEIFKEDVINDLYDIEGGHFNVELGSVELKKPEGEPEVFVIAGAGCGIKTFRSLQRSGTAFATGILYEHDIDYVVAKSLATKVVTAKPFTHISNETLEEAKALMDSCEKVIYTLEDMEECPKALLELLDKAKKEGKLLYPKSYI